MNNLLNFKSFLKFLSKHKSYTFIDIFGLSVSLMFVILIATYTIQELSTDNFQRNADNIYLMSNEDGYGTAYKIADRLLERYPEIEKTCVITHSNHQGELVVPIGTSNEKLSSSVLWADTTFFDFFDFELLVGDRNKVLDSRNYVVISETYAKKAFPGMDPLGQAIKRNDSTSYIVNGVMKDIKNSVIPYADILMRMDIIGQFNSGMDQPQFGNAGSAFIFVKTNPYANINSRSEEIEEYFREVFWIYERGIRTKVIFDPLKEVYFSEKEGGGIIQKGDWRFVMVLMSIGFVILIFAIINYINLTVAQTGFRAKEMATRRLLGSSRKELFIRLIMESTLLTLVSSIIGLLLAFAFIPAANNLLETRIDLLGMLTSFNLLIGLMIILFIGVISGLLPAIIISNAKPVDVVKGGFRQKTKMVFSKFFITFQNLITVTLIAVSITMILQINHLIKAPLGYKTTDIILIPTTGLQYSQSVTFINELEGLPVVKRAAPSQGFPSSFSNNSTTIYNGINVSFQQFVGNTTFIEMLGIQITRDNNLSNSDGYYLSKQAFREMGIPEDTPSATFDGDWTIAIAGVIDDFYLHNRTRNLSPLMLQIKKIEEFPWNWITHIAVEIEGDHRNAFLQIKNSYENFTHLDFPGEFVDQQITKSFASQIRTSRIVMVFTFIAVLISLLGLLAMSTYFIQQRSREVAVRKVFGSSNMQILTKLILTFLNYVGIAFVIAVPFIWYIGSRWLSDYDYRISLSPFIFITAGIICLGFSFLTVYWQSKKAANTNPVESIKAE